MAKYQDLFNRLKMAILRGEYAPNQRLPSENALAIRYRLSRITTKRALNELVAADLVYRVQGKHICQAAYQHGIARLVAGASLYRPAAIWGLPKRHYPDPARHHLAINHYHESNIR
nr:winged helix-turn-helix domain-containing protein [Lacticaseibacillus nasuensis]